jgi:putative addiction module component (TIGR02574 family)
MEREAQHPVNDPDKDPALSVSERILRLQDEWDEIAANPELVRFTPEQEAEMRRRVRVMHEYPRTYQSWDELRDELMGSGPHRED